MSLQTLKVLGTLHSGNVDGAFAGLSLGICTVKLYFEPTKQHFCIDKSRLDILGGPCLVQDEHEICLLLPYKQTLVSMIIFLICGLYLGKAGSLVLLKTCLLLVHNALKVICETS